MRCQRRSDEEFGRVLASASTTLLRRRGVSTCNVPGERKLIRVISIGYFISLQLAPTHLDVQVPSTFIV